MTRRFAFLIQIPFLLLSSAVIAWKVNVPLPPAVQSLPLKDKLNRIDYLGSFTLVLTISAVLLPISLKATEDIPWSHPLIWGLLVGSIIPGSAFVWVESRWAPYPILPLRLIKQRTVLAVALTNLYDLLLSSFRVTDPVLQLRQRSSLLSSIQCSACKQAMFS